MDSMLNTLIRGDCLEQMKKLTGQSIDCIIVDPPYSSGTRQAANRNAGNIPKRGERWNKERAGIIWDTSFSSFGLSVFMNCLLSECKRVLKDGAHIYIFIDWRQYPLLTMSVEHAGLFVNNLIVWDKTVYALGGNYRSQHELVVFASRGAARRLNKHDIGNVIQCKRITGGEHPTEKPPELLAKFISYSTNSGDTVLDPCAGSCSTGIAAIQTGRQFILFEKEETYIKRGNERLNCAAEEYGRFTNSMQQPQPESAATQVVMGL